MRISCCPMWAEKSRSLSVSRGDRTAVTIASCAAANESASRAFGAAPLRLISRTPRTYSQLEAASSAMTVGLRVQLVTDPQEEVGNGHRRDEEEEEGAEYLAADGEKARALRGD